MSLTTDMIIPGNCILKQQLVGPSTLKRMSGIPNTQSSNIELHVLSFHFSFYFLHILISDVDGILKSYVVENTNTEIGSASRFDMLDHHTHHKHVSKLTLKLTTNISIVAMTQPNKDCDWADMPSGKMFSEKAPVGEIEPTINVVRL